MLALSLVSYFSLLIALVDGDLISDSDTSQVALNHSHFDIHDSQTVPGFFQPPMDYETYDDGLPIPLAFMNSSLKDMASALVQDRLGINDGQLGFTSGYSSDTAEYAYFHQRHNGIPFVNAVANIVLQNARLVAFGSSFVKSHNAIAPSIASRQTAESVRIAEAAYGGTYNGEPIGTEYFAKPNGTVALVHVVQIQNEDAGTWFEVYVDAHMGELVGSADYVSHAGYQVVPIDRRSILEGDRFITNPQDPLASPEGWHSPGRGKIYWYTAGNNAVAYIDVIKNVAYQTMRGQIFQWRYETKKGPKEFQNPSAARVNAFYVANNFGKGGKGNDPVWISSQAKEKPQHASFATGPDGQVGRLRLGIHTGLRPMRDSDMDNTIIHEMAHGITNRMTGGGTARCLQYDESRGLGEGWSDSLADWTSQRSKNVVDFVFERYFKDKPNGIRKYPASVSKKRNPLMFSDLSKVPTRPKYRPHRAGEIWANTLHNVYAALVKKHGFSGNARTNPNTRNGNTIFLHLFLDALAIQPCNPVFTQARNAWIQADRNRYKGANRCLLWRAFASRGMGTDAKYLPHRDGKSIPKDCVGKLKSEEGEEEDDSED